ncbi:MAG: DedA family protein [Candidatus Doudnabacteria bacterium]|nr:DedA family protein [Candidatus Doudnabacteria bacterium]
MLQEVISTLTAFITNTISTLGYPGVAVLMGIESACIPLPSEIIAPFAGFLAYQGRFTLWGIALTGGIGSMAGSFITYEIGKLGGRPIIERYGKYILISKHDLDIADKFFAKYGNLSTFIGRLLPVVRTFISLPAGISKVPLVPFLIYSFVGSVIWTYVLAYFGMKLGENWNTLRDKLHGFDTAIIIFILIGGVCWVYRHFKHMRSYSPPTRGRE